MSDALNLGIAVTLGAVTASLLGFLAIATFLHLRTRRKLGVPPEPEIIRRINANSPCHEVQLWLREKAAHLHTIERCSCKTPTSVDGSRCEYAIMNRTQPEFEWQVSLDRSPGVFGPDLLLTVVFVDRKYQRFGYRRTARQSR